MVRGENVTLFHLSSEILYLQKLKILVGIHDINKNSTFNYFVQLDLHTQIN